MRGGDTRVWNITWYLARWRRLFAQRWQSALLYQNQCKCNASLFDAQRTQKCMDHNMCYWHDQHSSLHTGPLQLSIFCDKIRISCKCQCITHTEISLLSTVWVVDINTIVRHTPVSPTHSNWWHHTGCLIIIPLISTSPSSTLFPQLFSVPRLEGCPKMKATNIFI